MTYIDPFKPIKPIDSFIHNPVNIQLDSLNSNRFDSFNTYNPYRHNNSIGGLGLDPVRFNSLSPLPMGAQIMVQLNPMFRPLC